MSAIAMHEIPMRELPPEDQPARDRIATVLDRNFLVEAGAGSGKTTALVGRMRELVARGTPVERIAAVTFTRKAANELRERFQLELEKASREAPAGTVEADRFESALRDLDRAFLGTIHSFCARLLREHPLELGLDPGFQEVSEEEWKELHAEFWDRWTERTARAQDPALVRLRELGIEPRSLYPGFLAVSQYPDVDFPAGGTGAPDIAPCRRELERLLSRASELIPREEPPGGWDDLMRLVRRLRFLADVSDWSRVPDFCAAIEIMKKSSCDLTQKRWSGDKAGKAAAKQLGADFLALVEGTVADVLRCWREHRYPEVMAYLTRAAKEFERERHATGRLTFEDLLLLAARLLREHPLVRDALGARWERLLVDEFQDTDPVQAEVCFLLASDTSQGSDWRTVAPRPGSLFVVGDPKQSIYRFRRADIQVYELVKERLRACGEVLAFTANFRSVRAIETVVNAHFAGPFPAAANAEQAPFSEMRTRPAKALGGGVHRYVLRAEGRKMPLELDAAMVASWIAERIERDGRKPGDFLILTPTKKPIEHYARALAERNVAVTTTGAPLPQERELRELVVVLRAIADPDNRVHVTAALEGMFAGCSPADLYDAKLDGLHFAITHAPAERESITGRALAQLHAWWIVSQRHAADVLVERILEDTGLLFHAASQPLGEARAGALLRLVDSLRAGSVTGASAITDAMKHIELVLQQDSADAPLRPGRTDAVRVMNLHKAKGLEGEVVILAAPHDERDHEPTVHVTRGEEGRPTGGIVIKGAHAPVAQPPGWDAMAARERAFGAAEDVRLLYVAATRAKAELVVAQCERTTRSGTSADASMWSPLAPALAAHGTLLELTVDAAPGRRRMERTPDELATLVAAARERVRAASTPSLEIRTVTESAKEARSDARAYDLPRAGKGGAGAAWGSAVHRALEGAGRGRSGETLRAFVAAVARDEGLDDAAAAELERVVEAVRASDVWTRLTSDGAARFELPVMRWTPGESGGELVEGVMDAAVLRDGAWTIVDWKSDDVDEAAWSARLPQYARQVGTYERILAALGEAPATASIERVRRGTA